ncbi:MAG TPA: hypothetical protein VJ400_05495 [Thermoplasmata archaeon]|nr:hypothetical protein [Thermoplasmata archaeon]
MGILLLFSGGHGLVSSTAAILAGIVAAAMLPRFLGYYRTFRTHGPTIARATFVYGVAATTFFALAMTGAHAASGSFSTRDVVLVVLGYVALGPVFILEGAALIVLRRFTFSPSIALIAGVLFIVGGSFVASIFLSIYGGFFVLAPALMLGGIVLAKTPTP